MQLTLLWLLCASCAQASASKKRAFQDSGVVTESIHIEELIQHVQRAGPQKGALDEIEKSIMGMAQMRLLAGNASNDTNSTSSRAALNPFLDQISVMIDNTFKVNILKRRNVTQASLDAAWAALSNCTHPTSIDTQSLDELSRVHISCRESENTHWRSYDAACGRVHRRTETRCQAYQLANQLPDPATTCVMQPHITSPSVGNYFIEMEDYFTRRLDELLATKQECSNATNNSTLEEVLLCKRHTCIYYDEKLRCDQLQALLEAAACDMHKNVSCARYASCHADATRLYNSEVSAVQASEVSLKAEWEATHRIECYLRALREGNLQLQADIDTCKAATYETQSVAISYFGDAPAALPCSDSNSIVPGTSAFALRWYSSLPANAAALSCASSRCCASVLSTDYPSNVTCPV